VLKGKLLTVNEVLKITGISRYTLYRDSRNGKIKPIYLSSRIVRYREEDVKKYADEKKQSYLVNYYKQKKKERN
jgi:predicted site-specific integrase-resolvase